MSGFRFHIYPGLPWYVNYLIRPAMILVEFIAFIKSVDYIGKSVQTALLYFAILVVTIFIQLYLFVRYGRWK